MDLYVVMADLGNDRKDFKGVFSTQELAENYVEQVDKMYSSKVAYWEKVELDKP
jgi:hypothetical protein